MFLYRAIGVLLLFASWPNTLVWATAPGQAEPAGEFVDVQTTHGWLRGTRQQDSAGRVVYGWVKITNLPNSANKVVYGWLRGTRM